MVRIEPSEIESIVRTRTRPRREALHKRILWFGSEPFRAARFEPELNSNQNPAANPPKSNLSFEREPDAAVRRFTSEFYGSDPNHSAPRGSNSNQCRSFKRCVPNSSIISIACVGEFRAPAQSEAIQNPR